jgi:S1-C subfamily serine protease
MPRQFATARKRSSRSSVSRFYRVAKTQPGDWASRRSAARRGVDRPEVDPPWLLAASRSADPVPQPKRGAWRSWVWPPGMVAILGAMAVFSHQGDLQRAGPPTASGTGGRGASSVPAQPGASPGPAAPRRTVPPVAAPTELSAEQVYRKARSATVTVMTPTGTGSGVFVSASGLLLTNEHVVEQFPVVQIKTSTGSRVLARVVRVDEESDLAVLRVARIPDAATCLAIDTQPVRRGQTVYALGSPLQIEQVFTQGIVSADSPEAILHTASIAPGNSGGPLMNDQGQIVGINRAVLRRYDSMAVAVPTSAIRRMEIAASCGD